MSWKTCARLLNAYTPEIIWTILPSSLERYAIPDVTPPGAVRWLTPDVFVDSSIVRPWLNN